MLFRSALVPRSLTFELPLQGSVQLGNVSLAIATALLLRQDGWEIPNEAITQGIAKTKWVGRLQWYNWHHQSKFYDRASCTIANGPSTEFLKSPE